MKNFIGKVILIPAIVVLLKPFMVSSQETDDISHTTEQKDEKPISFRLSGFVKTDYWYDSRSVIAAREDLFLLFPRNIEPDVNGEDIYGDPIFNFSAITSRIAGAISGPEAFGAKTSGLLEADFSGVTNADINGFRLRHAYFKLDWPKLELLLGQWWHPMFGIGAVPTVISLNTGAPFQPFIRNPQVSVTYKSGKNHILLSAIAQRDNASDGPRGVTPDYLRQSALPNFHVQFFRKGESSSVGVGVDYKILRPALVTESLYKTAETLGTFALMGYFRNRWDLWDVKAKAIFGQNLSEHLMLGGYAENNIDPLTGEVSYTPLNHFMTWANVVYGENRQVGLFLGYSKNYGALDPVVGNYYGRGHDIDYLYRIAPSFSIISGKVQFSSEIEYTAAAYGTPDNMGIVRNAQPVGNVRVLFTGFYFF
ncbi:MAG: hypothetical protein ABR597_07600 [Bacteroidales bacterium]